MRSRREGSANGWAYEAFCAERGEQSALVALGWLLHQEAVAAPIIGPRTIEQLDSAVGATEACAR